MRCLYLKDNFLLERVGGVPPGDGLLAQETKVHAAFVVHGEAPGRRRPGSHRFDGEFVAARSQLGHGHRIQLTGAQGAVVEESAVPDGGQSESADAQVKSQGQRLVLGTDRLHGRVFDAPRTFLPQAEAHDAAVASVRNVGQPVVRGLVQHYVGQQAQFAGRDVLGEHVRQEQRVVVVKVENEQLGWTFVHLLAAQGRPGEQASGVDHPETRQRVHLQTANVLQGAAVADALGTESEREIGSENFVRFCISLFCNLVRRVSARRESGSPLALGRSVL